MKKDLYKLSDEVETEEDFVKFLGALLLDRENEIELEKETPAPPFGAGANGWENGEITTFLDAASAWAEATVSGTEFYQKPNNPWKRAAHILHAGKFYE